MNCCFSETWVVCFPAKLCTLGAGGVIAGEEEEQAKEEGEVEKDEQKKAEELPAEVHKVDGEKKEDDED